MLTDFEKRYQSMETLLFQGHAHTLAEALQQAAPTESQNKDALTREANYFRHHQRRMNYMELREDQWLIGSGSVESEAKQFKHRLAGAGCVGQGRVSKISFPFGLLSWGIVSMKNGSKPSPFLKTETHPNRRFVSVGVYILLAQMRGEKKAHAF